MQERRKERSGEEDKNINFKTEHDINERSDNNQKKIMGWGMHN